MAADKKIEVAIKTTADVAGAEAAKKAISDVDKEIAKLDANAKKVKQAPLVDANLSREAADRMNGFTEAATAAGRASDKLGKSGANAGLGMLALSQGIEDAQYGMRAVLNNIPQLIMYMGGGAGLAAVISMVAVATAVLGPHLKELVDGEDEASEATKRLLAAYREANAEAVKAIETATRNAQAERELRTATDNTVGSMVAANEATKERIKLLDMERESLLANRKAEDEIAKAKAELAAAQAGNDPVARQKAENEAARADRARSRSRMEEDLAIERKRLQALGDTSLSIYQQGRPQVDANREAERQAKEFAAEKDADAKRFQAYIDADQKELEAARKRKDTGESGRLLGQINTAKLQKEEAENAADQARKQAAAYGERAKAGEAGMDTELNKLRDEMAASMKRIRDLEKSIGTTGEAEPIRRQAEDTRLKTVQDEEARKAEEKKQREAEKKDRDAEAEERRRVQAGQSAYQLGKDVTAMGNRKGGEMLEQAGHFVANNPTAENEQKLMDLLGRVLKWAETLSSSNGKKQQAIKDLNMKVEQLERQIANNRE